MAALDDHTESDVGKMLMIGNNGAGKTGALVSLAEAGFNVNVLDFDNGVEILKQLASPEARARIDVETHVDTYKQSGGKMVPAIPLTGLSGAMKVLDNWPGKGKPTEWGPETVFALDSLTMMGKFAMNHALSLNGRLGQQAQIQDWGQAMDIQENVCAMLYGTLKCHVIVMAHITYIQPEGEVQQFGYPSALGSKLPPKIGSYFNHTLYVGETGFGQNKKKAIFTKSPSLVQTKTPAPGKVKDSYPLETGLADYFRDMGFLKS